MTRALVIESIRLFRLEPLLSERTPRESGSLRRPYSHAAESINQTLRRLGLSCVRNNCIRRASLLAPNAQRFLLRTGQAQLLTLLGQTDRIPW